MPDRTSRDISKRDRDGLIKRDLEENSMRRNPALALDITGYRSHLEKTDLVQAITSIQELGYEVPFPRTTIVTEEVSVRSVLQVIDCIIAHAFQKIPNLFTDDLDVTDVQITPIELKAYFTLLFLNRMRTANQMTGDAVGNIPVLSGDAPMPRAMFEMLSVMAPYYAPTKSGFLTMKYSSATEFYITNDCIAGPNYLPTSLESPACPTFQGNPVEFKGIHVLKKDPVTGEVLIISSQTIPAVTLQNFWTNNVQEDRIFFAVNQLFEKIYTYGDLPSTAVSADFFACSRVSNNGPANQLMCPFSNYNPDHASVFSFWKNCSIKATMNQKPRMQAPTRPNDNTSAAQYSDPYIVGVYVSQGERVDSKETNYLGSRKYYSYDGKSVRPAPQFKKVYPEVIKAQVIDAIRALQAQLGQAISSLKEDKDGITNLAAETINSPRFYREAALCMVSKIFKSVQTQCLSFMTTPSKTAISVAANSVQLFGAAALCYNSIAPIVSDENLVLPFFEFAQDLEIMPWYEMDFAETGPSGSVAPLYATTLTWSSVAANNDEYRVHFDEQIVNAAWVAAYSATAGARKVPFYALNSANRYQRSLQAFSVGSGTLLNLDQPLLGGSSMLSYTKYVRDTTQLSPLPVFDEKSNPPGETPFPFKYLLNVERILFMEFVFGLPYSEALVTIHSLDIEDDEADDLNEFPYSQPLNLIPGSDNPWSMVNSDVANSNGVFQKTYANMISAEHMEVRTILGVPVVPKTEDNSCFLKSIANTIASVADAVSTGASFLAGDASFGDVVSAGVGVFDAVTGNSVSQQVASGVYGSTNVFYQGSPSLKQSNYKSFRSQSTMYEHKSKPNHTKASRPNLQKPSNSRAAPKPRPKVQNTQSTKASKPSKSAKASVPKAKGQGKPSPSRNVKKSLPSQSERTRKSSPVKRKLPVQSTPAKNAKKPLSSKPASYPKPKITKPVRSRPLDRTPGGTSTSARQGSSRSSSPTSKGWGVFG